MTRLSDIARAGATWRAIKELAASRMKRACAGILVAIALAGCSTATPYGARLPLGHGYSEVKVEEGVYRVLFVANYRTGWATVADYWLYRCAEIALEQGYDGFEMLPPKPLAMNTPGPGWDRGGDRVGDQGGFIHARFVYIPIYTPSGGAQTGVFRVEHDIRLLKSPVEHKPPAVFDARTVKTLLGPYVRGEKTCENRKVCGLDDLYWRVPENEPAQPEQPEPPKAPEGTKL